MKNISDFVSGVTLREREELERSLLKGETIFWATKPVARLWSVDCIPLMIFATFWLGFIAFWTFGALGMPTSLEDLSKIQPAQIPFALFSIPFWLVGIVLASSPWWRRRKLERSLYVLTNRRALIVQPGVFSWSVEVYPLEEDMLLSRTAKPNGEGDLVFAINYENRPATRSGFMSVPDVQMAEQKLNEAMEAKKAAEAPEA